jgi:hypothetical protein
MNLTKQTTYSWDAVTNATEQEAIDFANQILSEVSSDREVSSNCSLTISKFEIAPRASEIQCNWYAALEYLKNLTINGKSGWRLPTEEELNEIYKYDNDFEKAWYWSSTENDGRAYTQNMSKNMGNGYKYFNNKNHGHLYVRAVRDI